MNQFERIPVWRSEDVFSHRQKQWAWQNGLTHAESLRRLLCDPSYCEKFGVFLKRAAERSPETAPPAHPRLQAEAASQSHRPGGRI